MTRFGFSEEATLVCCLVGGPSSVGSESLAIIKSSLLLFSNFCRITYCDQQTIETPKQGELTKPVVEVDSSPRPVEEDVVSDDVLTTLQNSRNNPGFVQPQQVSL
eukprot:c14609_g1_i4.p2 GENE.c14609_g1_i4~~c14609_g1_i4.p2  ORF type:complete len:105 (+),score=18.85 c14609_g1_i4:344-658(+)